MGQASLVAQIIKNLPGMRETWVPSLGWEDPLEKGTTTHSSILAWRIPWTVEPGWLVRGGHKESDTTECLSLFPSSILSVQIICFFLILFWWALCF